MSAANLLASLSSSLECLPLIVTATTPASDKLTRHSTDGGWSAHDHLAHLARYQHVFMFDRCHRILHEDNPSIARYRAEDDPEWPSWQQRTTRDVIESLKTGRSHLSALLGSAAASDWQRVGTHAVFGPLRLEDWVQFFLVHEGHHLYVAWGRSRG